MPPEIVVPPVVIEQPPVPPVPPVPLPQIVWGRWQAAADKPAVVDIDKLTADKAERIAQDSNFAVFRTAGAWTPPQQGAVGFSLQQSEALIRNETNGLISPARLENGKLNVDFGKSAFTTSFDLLNDTERFSLQSKGVLGSGGQLSGDSQFSSPTNMNVTGVVGPENGMSAAYIFSSRLDPKRIASGITYWIKQ
jgi:hypothetical protein